MHAGRPLQRLAAGQCLGLGSRLVDTRLLPPQIVRSYTRSDAKIDAKVGGAFSIFGGNVTGVIKDLVPHQRIVQAWRFSSWDEGKLVWW